MLKLVTDMFSCKHGNVGNISLHIQSVYPAANKALCCLKKPTSRFFWKRLKRLWTMILSQHVLMLCLGISGAAKHQINKSTLVFTSCQATLKQCFCTTNSVTVCRGVIQKFKPSKIYIEKEEKKNDSTSCNLILPASLYWPKTRSFGSRAAALPICVPSSP